MRPNTRYPSDRPASVPWPPEAPSVREARCPQPPRDRPDDDERAWQSASACQSADPDLFFPISSAGPGLDQVAEAKAICARCPVQAECLVFALRTRQLHGIWGGTTERERYQLWRGDERGTDQDPGDGRPGRPHANQRRPRISMTSAASPGSPGRGR